MFETLQSGYIAMQDHGIISLCLFNSPGVLVGKKLLVSVKIPGDIMKQSKATLNIS